MNVTHSSTFKDIHAYMGDLLSSIYCAIDSVLLFVCLLFKHLYTSNAIYVEAWPGTCKSPLMSTLRCYLTSEAIQRLYGDCARVVLYMERYMQWV